MRVIFVICLLCFAAAGYSGYRIVSETHLPRSNGPSQVPGMSNGSHRDSAAMLDQEQRVGAPPARISGNASVVQAITRDKRLNH